jgi:signal transduction histidine kinase
LTNHWGNERNALYLCNTNPDMKSISPESTQLLVKTVQDLSLARDLDTVMKIVRTAARQLTGADGATFVLRDNGLCYYADEDAIAPLWKGSRFPMSACVSGWAMLNRRPAVIQDIYADDRIPADAYRPTFVKSLAMVPIRTKDPIGAIGNYWAEQRQPTDNEVWMLQSLADITAVTMENVKIYTELEQRVKERTVQLELINKELEAFSYSVSHDLRAPLRAISGYTSILIEDHSTSLDEEGLRVANKILNSAGNMNRLIDDLLHFFRTDKAQLQKTTVPIHKMVKDLIESVREEGRDITFIVEELPDASADTGLIRQVWTNLLSNAVKYTRKKEKAIIRISTEKKENDIIYIVEDNGDGFDMNYYNKLFGVFQRLHAASQFEGTGIGLATVQRIVHRHGGKIWAKAQPGEGATFYFSLPAR